jgi:hypothetical protein
MLVCYNMDIIIISLKVELHQFKHYLMLVLNTKQSINQTLYEIEIKNFHRNERLFCNLENTGFKILSLLISVGRVGLETMMDY